MSWPSNGSSCHSSYVSNNSCHNLLGCQPQLLPTCTLPVDASGLLRTAQGCMAPMACEVPQVSAMATDDDFSGAEELAMMLESELTAAGLQAVMSLQSTAPLDPISRQLSKQLAAAVVENSCLCDDISLSFASSRSSSCCSAAACLTPRDLAAAPARSTCTPAAAALPSFVMPQVAGVEQQMLPGPSFAAPGVTFKQQCRAPHDDGQSGSQLSRLCELWQQMQQMQDHIQSLRHQLGI